MIKEYKNGLIIDVKEIVFIDAADDYSFYIGLKGGIVLSVKEKFRKDVEKLRQEMIKDWERVAGVINRSDTS